MKYRHLHGYKYELIDPIRIKTELPMAVMPAYVRLNGGSMTIRPGYAWDGPSGPAFDTKTFMRGSLVHDVYYQMMREGYISPKKWRKYADEELRRVCIEDGMSKFRAWYAYRFVRVFGKFTCKPRKNPRGKVVEI